MLDYTTPLLSGSWIMFLTFDHFLGWKPTPHLEDSQGDVY